MQSLPMQFDAEARRAQMFPVLTRELFERIAAFGAEKTFEDGEILFEQGDRDTPFFVVVDGEIEVLHPQGGRDHLVTVLRAREFTGEVAMLSDRRTLVRARAKGRLRTIRIEYGRLRSLLQTDSEFSDMVMRAYILRRVGLMAEGRSEVVLIGSRHSAATLNLQEFLTRNGHPYRYVDVDREPEVERLLGVVHVEPAEIPILLCGGKRVLRNPSEAEVADCLGLNPDLHVDAVQDLVICGAGPAGLAAAVYAASEGLAVLVVDSTAPGGQAAASSKIENYLGFPTGVSGQALAARAVAQAEKFGAKLAVARGAVGLDCNDSLVRIDLAGGESVRARAVVVATGARYRKLGVPELARFEGSGVYYAATFVEAQRCAAEEVIVVGGGNSAGQAATFLARGSRHVHVLVRGAGLAASMSRYLIRRIEETRNITLHHRTEVVGLHGAEHLEGVTWREHGTGRTFNHAIRHVFSMAGASPNTEWLEGCVVLDPLGFVLTDSGITRQMLAESRWPLARAPYLFETTRPRVFAVGDVRAASVKRVASAVGEGSVCIQLVQRALTA